MFHRYLQTPTLILAALISLTANSQDVVTYFHTDIVGSPVAATDAYGNTVWTEDYAPFGERWTVDADAYPNRQWFTDHTEDRETGLIYAGARYYDSQTARFLSRDPAAVVAEQPFTFNRYAYANNNPYAYVDPDGKSVYSRVIKLAFNGGDFALTFAGVYQDWRTLDVNSTASGWEKGVAFASILSELAPVSVRDTKDLYRWMNGSNDAARAIRLARPADGITLSADEALDVTLSYLGSGSREIAPGVFRSADGTRQVRMTSSDLATSGNHAGAPHFNFEEGRVVTGPTGRETFRVNPAGNSHVFIEPKDL